MEKNHKKNIRGYFDKNGIIIDTFSKNVIINDLKQIYYTRLKNHKDYSITFINNPF